MSHWIFCNICYNAKMQWVTQLILYYLILCFSYSILINYYKFRFCLKIFSLVWHIKSYLKIFCLNGLFLRPTINVGISNGHYFNEHINMAIKFYATPNKNWIPKGILFFLKQKVENNSLRLKKKKRYSFSMKTTVEN